MSAPHLLERVRSQRAEVRELGRKLDQVVQVSANLPHGEDVARVTARLRPVFAREVRALDRSLDDLERRTSSPPLVEAWKVAESVFAEVDRVAEELLLFVEGALARATGLDGGVCAVVDRLLDDLAKRVGIGWERTTIPAARESTSNRTWIIGLPLTETTIWSLPVMVHEFGHFASARLEDRYGQRPGVAIEDATWIDSAFSAERAVAATEFFRKVANPIELFADVFAGYAMGPAYAATLAWRASPHGAWESRRGHPGWGFRVHGALRAVRAEGRSWTWFADTIDSEWRRELEHAGCAPVAEHGLCGFVDVFVDRVLDLLQAAAPGARFADERGVLEAAERLAREGGIYEGLDVPTVVNAAWMRRTKFGFDGGAVAIGDTALRWCRELAERPMASGTGHE